MRTFSVATDTLARVESYLAQTRRDLRLPGLSVSVVQHGEVVYTAGFGMAAPGRAVSPQIPFILGSLSKSFTALAVMQLVERGLFDLDAPVQKYLPWFRVADTGRVVTIRQLLTHTSGFPRSVGRNLLAGHAGTSIEQSVRDLRGLKLAHAPGSLFEYSNLNYLVLSSLIEVASGVPYPRYIQECIFQPLSMRHSFVSEQEALAGGLAQGHRWVFGWPVPFTAPYLYDAQGAAFLISSAEDMARWLLLHLSDGEFEGARLLSPAGMEELHRPFVPTLGAGSMAAMGWRVERLGDESLLRHGGEVSNFRGDMILVPGRGLGVVVLQNSNNGLVAQLGLDQIGLNVVRLLLDLPLPRKRPFLRHFSMFLLLVVVGLTLGVVALWPSVLFVGPGLPGGLLLALGVVWPLLVLWRVPVVADMGWRGLRLYVPDVARWLFWLALVSLAVSAVLLLRWL